MICIFCKVCHEVVSPYEPHARKCPNKKRIKEQKARMAEHNAFIARLRESNTGQDEGSV